MRTKLAILALVLLLPSVARAQCASGAFFGGGVQSFQSQSYSQQFFPTNAALLGAGGCGAALGYGAPLGYGFGATPFLGAGYGYGFGATPFFGGFGRGYGFGFGRGFGFGGFGGFGGRAVFRGHVRAHGLVGHRF